MRYIELARFTDEQLQAEIRRRKMYEKSGSKACCDELYRDGKCVAIMEIASTYQFEMLLQLVRDELGMEVDWFSMAGRACVKCRPDNVDSVREAIRRIVIPEVCKGLGYEFPQIHDPKRRFYVLYDENGGEIE